MCTYSIESSSLGFLVVEQDLMYRNLVLMFHNGLSGLYADTFLGDFLLTHNVFMPTPQLCRTLLQQYPSLVVPPQVPAVMG